MTIRNPYGYVAGIWDWAILRGCFASTAIQPTDIDGFVERHGKFLVIETKGTGATLPTGQQRTFERLRATGVFTVIVVWGKTNAPQRAKVYMPSGISQEFTCDLFLFRRLVATWFSQVNRGQPVELAMTILKG